MDKSTHQIRCEQWTRIINECLASGMPKTSWCILDIKPSDGKKIQQNHL